MGYTGLELTGTVAVTSSSSTTSSSTSLSTSSVTRAGSRSGGCDITGDCVCDMAFFWSNKNCYPFQPSPPCSKCYLNRSEICKQVSKSLLPVEFCLLAVINTTWGRDPAQIDPTVIQRIIDSQYFPLSIEFWIIELNEIMICIMLIKALTAVRVYEMYLIKCFKKSRVDNLT